MINVLHICYPGVGGQAAVATGLAVEGTRAGSKQAVVFYGVEPTAEQYLELCDADGIEHVSIVKKPGIGIGARRKLRAAINALDPEVVIAHHHDTCITAVLNIRKSQRASVVFVEHHSNALKSRKDWALSGIAHCLSDHTIYLTDTYRHRVQDKLGCFHYQKKTSVIPNGLDLELYSRSHESQPSKITIGMQGRMDEGKDFSVLLDSFTALQENRPELDLSLELVGDGPHRIELEKKAPANTNFTGFLSHDELVKRMGSWDIAVLATEGETLSMAVLEAWALGIPLVASDVPGVGDLINDETDGLLFETKSSAALCDRLTQLIDNSAFASQLGQAGRSRVAKQFSRQQIWKRYHQLIRKLLQPAAQHVEPANLDSLQ